MSDMTTSERLAKMATLHRTSTKGVHTVELDGQIIGTVRRRTYGRTNNLVSWFAYGTTDQPVTLRGTRYGAVAGLIMKYSAGTSSNSARRNQWVADVKARLAATNSMAI